MTGVQFLLLLATDMQHHRLVPCGCLFLSGVVALADSLERLEEREGQRRYQL